MSLLHTFSDGVGDSISSIHRMQLDDNFRAIYSPGVVRPETFGFTGLNVAADTIAIQNAANNVPIGGTLSFDSPYYKFTSITFNTLYGRIQGSGILDGNILVTSNGSLGQAAYITLSGLTWAPAAQDNTLNCITLQNLLVARILNCNFRAPNICIYIPNNA